MDFNADDYDYEEIDEVYDGYFEELIFDDLHDLEDIDDDSDEYESREPGLSR